MALVQEESGNSGGQHPEAGLTALHTFRRQWDDLVLNSTILMGSIILKGGTFLTYVNFISKGFKKISPSSAVG